MKISILFYFRILIASLGLCFQAMGVTQSPVNEHASGTVVEWHSPLVRIDKNTEKVESGLVEIPIDSVLAVTRSFGGDCLALKVDGTLWWWRVGDSSGKLGGNTNSAPKEPVQVPVPKNIKAISIGFPCLALDVDGNVWTGNRPTGNRSLQPSPLTQVANLAGIKAISAGDGFCLALDKHGDVWTWGSNWCGQLGDGSAKRRDVPACIPGLSHIIAISAGQNHGLALDDDGTVWAWGENSYGQLGDGTNTDQLTPVQIPGLNNITAICAGYSHSLALRKDGSVWSWGENSAWQLGDGTKTRRNKPCLVKGIADVSAIGAGEQFSTALRTDGQVYCWGFNWDTSYQKPKLIPGITSATGLGQGSSSVRVMVIIRKNDR